MLDIKEVMKLLPHRYPMIMVDRVSSLIKGSSIVARKNVTINEPFFVGHFPDEPVMPGVLIVEAMAQAAGILLLSSGVESGDSSDFLFYFMSIDNANFRIPVVPGDSLDLHINLIARRGLVCKFEGYAMVEDKKVADAKFTVIGKKK